MLDGQTHRNYSNLMRLTSLSLHSHTEDATRLREGLTVVRKQTKQHRVQELKTTIAVGKVLAKLLYQQHCSVSAHELA